MSLHRADHQRFALGDLSWFQESPHRSRRRGTARAPTVADWSERWLEEARGEIGEHTWRTYRTEANDLGRRFAERRLDQITVADLMEIRRDLKCLGRSDRTIRNRLAFHEGHLLDASSSAAHRHREDAAA